MRGFHCALITLLYSFLALFTFCCAFFFFFFLFHEEMGIQIAGSFKKSASSLSHLHQAMAPYMGGGAPFEHGCFGCASPSLPACGFLVGRALPLCHSGAIFKLQ